MGIWEFAAARTLASFGDGAASNEDRVAGRVPNSGIRRSVAPDFRRSRIRAVEVAHRVIRAPTSADEGTMFVGESEGG
jgi:hypothetical protein